MEYLLVVLVIEVAIMIACASKGKPGFAVLGLVCMIFPLVGLCRLAKPDSYWSLNHYGHTKMLRSWERYQKTPYQPLAVEPERPMIDSIPA